jgi:fluoroquinolone transport system permease protein
VFRLRTLRALGAIDTGSVLADPMLRWLAVVPLMAALAVRGLLPPVAERVGALAGVDLGWVVGPLSGYAVVGIAPLIAGAVVGFLLLDQRDDRTLLALQVTPLPLGLYLAYRLAAPTAVAFVVTLAALAVAGGLGLSPGAALLAALASAPLAPLAALALAAFARNKVQGAALMKAASLVLMAPLAGLFLGPGWGLALMALPTTWVARATWALQAGASPWPWVLGGWGISALVALVLLWRTRAFLSVGR